MTKNVVIALILFLVFCGIYCIRISTMLVKNQAWIEEQVDFARSLPAKEPREKHMLKAKESCQAVSFTSVSWEEPTIEIPAKLFA